MKYNKLKIFITLILLFNLQKSTLYAQSAIDSLIKTLPGTCEELMKERGWPSMSIAIIYDQNIVYSEAFGYANIEKNKLATTNTIYRVGSVSKVFLATSLMQLVERGKVNLNDHIVKYIPEYKPKYIKNTGPTTLRQLVTHTSGLSVDAGQIFWHYLSNFLWIVNKGKSEIDWGVSKKELVSSLGEVELEYIPNQFPKYSNFGFQLLGIALENVTSESIDDYVKTNILTPLTMGNSGFTLNEEQKERVATGYVYLEPDFTRYLAPDWESEIIKYSGGLYSTPEDIARFVSFQFCDINKNISPVLSGDGIRMMRTPQTLMDPISLDTYGIGWALYQYQGHQVVAHAGGHWGYGAKVEFIPDLNLGVVIMTNCNYPQGYLGPEKDITKIIYEKFVPLLKKKIVDPNTEPNKIELNKYIGTYSVPGKYANAEIYIKDDSLHFVLSEKPEFDAVILPVKFSSFCFAIDAGKNELFHFYNDEQGNIVSLKFLDYLFKKNE